MSGYWANRTSVNKANMCVPYALQDGYPFFLAPSTFMIELPHFTKGVERFSIISVEVKNAPVKNLSCGYMISYLVSVRNTEKKCGAPTSFQR